MLKDYIKYSPLGSLAFGFSLLSGLYVQIKSAFGDPIPQTTSDKTIPRDKSPCFIHASPPQEPCSTPYLVYFLVKLETSLAS